MFLSRLPTRGPLIRNFNAPTGQKLFIYRRGGSTGRLACRRVSRWNHSHALSVRVLLVLIVAKLVLLQLSVENC